MTSEHQVCACGTFAIGLCTQCGAAVCGQLGCSNMRAQKRVCTEHIREAARQEALEAERAERLAAEEAEAEARRQAKLDNTPIEMTDDEAFETLFLQPDASNQEVISAYNTFDGITPVEFTALARQCLNYTHNPDPESFSLYRGPTRSIVGKVMQSLKTVWVWWFDDSMGLTTDGKWLWKSSGGMGAGDNYEFGGSHYRRLSGDDLARLLTSARSRINR